MVWLVWYIHSISMLMGYQISSAMYIRSMNFIKTASGKKLIGSLLYILQLVLQLPCDNGNVIKRMLRNFYT